ncbi:MAG: hypothetical protein R3C16_12820 [Hyphomonadaceae bacterium]
MKRAISYRLACANDAIETRDSMLHIARFGSLVWTPKRQRKRLKPPSPRAKRARTSALAGGAHRYLRRDRDGGLFPAPDREQAENSPSGGHREHSPPSFLNWAPEQMRKPRLFGCDHRTSELRALMPAAANIPTGTLDDGKLRLIASGRHPDRPRAGIPRALLLTFGGLHHVRRQ